MIAMPTADTPIRMLAEDDETEARRPQDLQVREWRQQRGRRVHEGVREAPMAKAREQAHQQEQRQRSSADRRWTSIATSNASDSTTVPTVAL